ncbi:MAG TPA: hypothetical protein DCS83_05675 [Prevotella sp.]|nr:hypothetical protein [Prevotella sp.]
MKNKLVVFLMLVGGICFSSCKEDESASYNAVGVDNLELKAVLQAKGYTFDAEGKMVQDDKVLQTTSLDLSNCSLDNASGLGVFPNLTEVNLSDNQFSKSFDFSVLPSSVAGVNLTGMNIYEYKGLAKITTAENGDETVAIIHPLTKLYLPEDAKYDQDQVLAFYEKNETSVKDGIIDMKMQTSSGKLATYNTLRNVPDKNFRSILKSSFPSLFDGDSLDISRRLVKPSETGAALTSINMSKYTTAVDNIDGFQYVMNNKGYIGTFVYFATNKNSSVLYFPVNSDISQLTLDNISTPNGIDFSQAKGLTYLYMHKNSTIESLDLSASTVLGQRGDDAESSSFPDYITILSCEKIKNISFPSAAKVLGSFEMTNCPSMEKIDLSQFETMADLSFGLLPSSCKIIYLTPKRFIQSIDNGKMIFGIDEDIYNRVETKTFLDKYHEHLGFGGPTSGNGATLYVWTRNYK